MTDSTRADLDERKYFFGDGVDSTLRELLGRVADEAASRTSIAIVMPTKEILGVFHRVFHTVPRIPDYEPEGAADRRWSTPAVYSSDEIPEGAPELGVHVAETYGGDVVVRVLFETGETCDESNLDPRHAEEFFLAGLAAVREARRRRAERPVVGISDEAATAALADRGIVIGGRATEAEQAAGKTTKLILPGQD
jgi:hypothetical protein